MEPRYWNRSVGWWSLVVGIALGYLFFTRVDPNLVAVAIATITLAFTADWFLRGRKAPPRKLPVAPPLALVAGAASGFTTFVAHAGGPPIAIYLLRRGLHKSVYAGTTIAIFTLGNAIKLVPYGLLAYARPSTIWAALALAPAVPFGVWAGKYLHDRLEQHRLFFWCYLLLIVAAGKLLFDGLRSLTG
jgi:hypothetical protein